MNKDIITEIEEKTDLSEIKDGERFIYKGIEFIRLGKEQGGILCITAKVWEKLPFDKDCCNNFKKSSLCEVLQEKFLPLLDKSDLLPYEMDLTADNGDTAYGKVTVKVGLISCDLYRKYRNFIPLFEEWIWTCTALHCNSGKAGGVRFVGASGTLYDCKAHNDSGVFPACIFKEKSVNCRKNKTKSVLRRANPYLIYLIIIGKKTIEIGKDAPISEEWNRTVEMYCSYDKESFNRIPKKDRKWMRKYLGNIALRFTCDEIDEFLAFENKAVQNWNCLNLSESCLSYEEIGDYIGANGKGYAWHISDLKVYDTPKELRDFTVLKKCTSCKVSGYESSACIYNENCMVPMSLLCPPQSWCYVE